MRINKYLPVAIILALLPAAPAAAQYAARRNGDVIELEDAKNKMTVTVTPLLGNNTADVKVNGHSVLRSPNGNPFLAPWANRLDEQAFYANGKKYALDMALGNVTGAIPIHGFLQRTDQWQVVELKQDGNAAWVTSRLDVYKQPMWMKQWPFAHTIEMTYRLEAGVLEVRTRIKNMSAEPMPIAIGYHTYYQLTDSPRPEWTVNIPAKTHWLLSDLKIPTGQTEPAEKVFPNGQGVLKDYMLDDVFSDLTRDAQGRAHVFLKGKQQQLEIMFGPTWKSLVIFTPGAGRGGGAGAAAAGANPPSAAPAAPAAPLAIAFEPMAGITDALNLAQKGLYKELQSVAPDATWEASFWIKPTGF